MAINPFDKTLYKIMKQNQQKKRLIAKYSDEQRPFSSQKLNKSLRVAGADANLVKEIAREIEKTQSISSTKDIHDYAFRYLKKKNRPVAARYNLKRAIAEFGPTGFPFEKFVGELLRKKGYSVKVGQIISGKCVKHEIDVVAEKGNEHFMIECKFHNKHWIKSHVQTSLYVKARFDDVERAWIKKAGHSKKFHQAWIVTNTKFTSEATKYAKCAGVKLISWDYPKGEGLADIIDELGLHPITTLTTINRKQKVELVERGIVLCRDVTTDTGTSFLRQIGLKENKIKGIVEESRAICRL